MKLTIKQLDKISHSLGINFFNAMLSHKLKEKKLPKTFYRNRYQCESDKDLDELVEFGYVEKTNWQDLPFYHITDMGIEAFKEQYTEMVNYKKPADRDLSYLKKRINYFCDVYYYRFCDDNSEHILSAYFKYFLKSEYMSHTTNNVIKYFKNELKQAHKKGIIDVDRHCS